MKKNKNKNTLPYCDVNLIDLAGSIVFMQQSKVLALSVSLILACSLSHSFSLTRSETEMKARVLLKVFPSARSAAQAWKQRLCHK